MLQTPSTDAALIRYSRVMSIVGDILEIELPAGELPVRVCNRDLALVHGDDGHGSLAQILRLHRRRVFLQVFAGTRGLSNRVSIRFLQTPLQAVYSNNALGRVFGGTGEPIDSGPALEDEERIDVDGPSVNPMRRVLASRMIRTDIPMIDVFNCLVESQKIPIFSVAGEPYNQLLARIGIQADTDVVIFGGLGMIFDDYYAFRQAFEDAGVFHRTMMFVNLASDPVVERLMVPDLVLAVAEAFAVKQSKRVLVLLSDMTAYADAMKEVGIALEHIPSNRGYMGDLYSQLARRYERACDYKGAGSVTIISVTTMPGDDVTHPVPDNTGYITEGQFYLHNGVIDPFGSLSRLKQHVVGKETREDHGQVMNIMIRYYAQGVEAEQKQAMAFELSEFDRKLLRFMDYFKSEFMAIDVAMPLEDALNRCWQILAQCFERGEIPIKQSLLDKYWPDTETAQ